MWLKSHRENSLFKFLWPWRTTSQPSSALKANAPKTMPPDGTMRAKRRSEKADLMVTKKTRRLTNSGFLDRAFENAWYLPEDDIDYDSPRCLSPYVFVDEDNKAA